MRRLMYVLLGAIAITPLVVSAAKPTDPQQIWSERGNGQGPLPMGFVPPPSLAPLVKQLKPAVVNISTTQVIHRPAMSRSFAGPGQPDDPLDQFFNRFFGEQQPTEQRRQSLGSGFIINSTGLVITNNHVIDQATEIKVKLSDGREFSAEVKGHDPKTDVALLQLKGHVKDLPIVYLGDSDALEVGDWALAIGNPFGLEETVSHGIVSAKERVIGAGPYDDFIQTDAPINPGNSGGPLFNIRGEVVGVNTAILSPSGGGSVGIGFAVPINIVKEELPQLVKTGHVTRGWLGVSIQDLTPELARSLKLEQTHGAVVSDVIPGGPADKAGVKPGDVVVELNGKPVESFYHLLRAVAGLPPGATAKLEIVRDSKKTSVTVKVGERPEDDQLARASSENADRLGLRVGPLTPDVARSVGVPEGHGVAVVEVKEESPAALAGVRPGDVIVEVDRHPVDSVGAYQTAIAQIKAGDLVLLRVQRQNASLFIAVRVE